MNKLAVVIVLFCLLCSGVIIFAIGENNGQSLQKVEVSGKVRLVGNSPMTSLVISGETREWYVEPDEETKLMHLQQQTVTVKASEYYRDRVFANGSSAGRHYYLKNIVLINPKH